MLCHRVVVLVGLTLVASSCGGQVNISGIPACTPPEGGFDSTVVLMAQAVPSASALPCVRGLPVGWTMGELNVRNGSAQFVLMSDRDGDRALVVRVAPDCDVAGATEVPSEQPGLRRYERVNRVEGGYGGERYYVYDGGCTTYSFDLRGSTRAQPLASVAQALGFISRKAVSEQIDEYSDGRLELNPVTS